MSGCGEGGHGNRLLQAKYKILGMFVSGLVDGRLELFASQDKPANVKMCRMSPMYPTFSFRKEWQVISFEEIAEKKPFRK